jgi:hypothetical protein
MKTSKNAVVIVCRDPGNLGASVKSRGRDKIDPEKTITREMSMVLSPPAQTDLS